jgi:glycosyltransferase involved in cell wall biosynthesis
MSEVSIVIPAYNRLELLEQTLQSCLNQTFTDCEVLVIDDGSDTPIEPAIEKLRQNNNSAIPILHFRQERAGANAARNLGIRKSSGQYIQFLDSDDLLHPRKIELQKKILDSNPDLDMCYCLNEHFRETPGDMKILWNVSDQQLHLDRLLWFDHVWQTGSPLWRKAVFENISWWNEDLICLQEWEFHSKALAKKIRYAHVPYVLQYLREHDKPRSSNLSPFLRYQQSVRIAIRSVYEYLESCGLLTSNRRDALATALLASADDLIRNSFKEEGLISLDLANQYAAQSPVKHLAEYMKTASQNRILWMTIGRYVRNKLTRIVREKAGLYMKTKVQSDQLISDQTNIETIKFQNFVGK